VTKILFLWNLALTFGFVIVVSSSAFHHSLAPTTDTIRARQIDIVDADGAVRATIGYDKVLSTPSMALKDATGHNAFLLRLNSHGFATMDFQNGLELGKVEVGYLWGSDQVDNGSGQLGTWGVRVRDPKTPAILAVPDGNAIKERQSKR
jgi:hypothetical protein